MNRIQIKLSLMLSLVVGFAFAQKSGGMWIPNELNEKEMKEMGMKISAKDIFNPNAPSIKDAVAHFGGGCTSEVISPQGLLLTNHHCGYGQIQAHSSVEHDYLKDGFWAKSNAEELPNPGLTATFIVDIKDITPQVKEATAVKAGKNQLAELTKQAIEKIKNNYPKQPWQEVMVKPFYKGNKYYLFVTETFKDVRLVGAPPSSIGKFGSDTDNWVWPRHTGDFSIFRIYADKNNRPAEYSKDNVPYKPEHFLPINIKGINEGDFTFVFGFPGTTDEYLPASSLEQVVNVLNPAKIKVRDNALKIMDKYMKADQKTKIQYAATYASIANYWKKWIGESQGIQKSNAVEHKKAYEQRLQEKINKKCKQNKNKPCDEYPTLIADLGKLNKEVEEYNLVADMFSEAIYRNSQLLRMALNANNLLMNTDKDYYDKVTQNFKGIYKNFNPQVEEEVALKMWELYHQEVPATYAPNSLAITPQDIQNSIIFKLGKEGTALLDNQNQFLAELKKDNLVKKVGALTQIYYQEVSAPRQAIQQKIDEKMMAYMKAQLELMQDEKRFFPDANSTLRVTYGKVKGYEPRDAVEYEPKTYLKGIMEKYIPGDYEFDVSPKLIELFEQKDYGIYGEKGKMPVNFIATNHTTGGNSGSPALDANGNLIGLNFDRVWEGTMSDLYYDSEICRNIMVDMRYVLFVIDKYAGAKRLIKEMKILK
ncbi:S46 family peptidase [Ornithobacterium rhinotracheale]|uniref:Dipeptidyl-peptidase n=2 Tax=Ornithobacterium rhinotracheale TaxID=28251 RepID=I4A251_ORNRL|nr:S46 family peptidase [Ornithobacterium rhinotracheale]AFL98035.1 Peptidase S46 [Ornithobacterium rhinotracheale DSM 15997]AIP99812.1 peptidase S46 [Ornithobacterium rhinotracheale ORT-UMN 88]KGB66014.1 peptidase S46 [Ornithobacterium rhinotracheale H06-030791]MCK0193672.1 S46 family peptidase [Ornithobacterium rhinotracheale]UOH63724.1 S46 family peptidase [Ornithobacterium rhinotracheale]